MSLMNLQLLPELFSFSIYWKQNSLVRLFALGLVWLGLSILGSSYLHDPTVAVHTSSFIRMFHYPIDFLSYLGDAFAGYIFIFAILLTRFNVQIRCAFQFLFLNKKNVPYTVLVHERIKYLVNFDAEHLNEQYLALKQKYPLFFTS